MKTYKCDSYGYARHFLEYSRRQALWFRLTGRKPKRYSKVVS